MKKKRIFGIAGLAAVVLAASAGIYYTTSQHDSKGNGDLKVVTSFYPVYEFTKQIVGDEGEVSYLIPAGSEAHDFQPSTKNVADIEKADTFVYLNENMETWVPKIEKTINTKNTKVIEASKGMVLLPGTEEEDHDHGGEEHHHEYDPHVWLSPKRSQKLVKTIRDGLIAQHPDKKAVFTTNAEKYLKKLQALDKEYTEALSHTKQKSFVTQHAAFAYLALDYGLTQVPISGVSAESDPSAKRIASLSKYVKEYDINYIYFEENASSSVAKTLANEVGVKTAVLNPIESLTKEQLKKGEDYVSVMT
ncbi:metal ABC transporter substrate-binding protein, partial [Streptococcus vestibularis]